jgi:hypothetical protein
MVHKVQKAAPKTKTKSPIAANLEAYQEGFEELTKRRAILEELKKLGPLNPGDRSELGQINKRIRAFISCSAQANVADATCEMNKVDPKIKRRGDEQLPSMQIRSPFKFEEPGGYRDTKDISQSPGEAL